MKKLNIIFITFSLFLTCCDNTINQVEIEFTDYLKAFNIKPSENCTYLFVPSTQCAGCINLNASKFTDTQNRNTYIFSNLTRTHFVNFKNYVYDKEDKITSLKFVNFDNKLVYFSKGKILFCTSVNINELIKDKKCNKNR